MTRFIGLVLVGTVATMTIAQSHARLISMPPYQELFKRAQLVVIAKAVSTVDAGKDAGNNEYWVAVVTTLNVIQVIKGEHADGELILFHYRFTEKGRFVDNRPFFVKFDTSRTPPTEYMLFLNVRPDGRYECVTGQTDPAFSLKRVHYSPARWVLAAFDGNSLSLCERYTGQELCQLKTPGPSCLGFSPDGRFLAARGSDQMVRLWNVHDFKQVGQFAAPVEPITRLLFTPDSRRLVSAGQDSALVWDLPRPEKKPDRDKLDEKAIDQAFRDLGGNSAIKASQAMDQLARAPVGATRWLAAHIAAIPNADVRLLDKWIEDLDSAQFTNRSQAETELAKLGRIAERRMRNALKRSESLEQRRRLESLLKKIPVVPRADELLGLRGVQLLERLGTKQAIALLRQWARGAPETLLTQEARVSLRRLESQARVD